jgi:alkylation response protein AidB-like acyl-CoA dehydrogenase
MVNANVINCRHEAWREDEEACRSAARTWLENHLPLEWRPDRVGYTAPTFDAQRAWERRLYEAGFAGFSWPTEYGGQGLTVREQLICNEEFGRIGIPDSVNAIGKDMIGPIILALGNENQKRGLLPRILSMQDIWCQAFSESEAGSDLAEVRTRATRDGNQWLINGSKTWTSFAHLADWCVLLARTGDRAQKHASLSLFTVPMKSPGITVKQIDQIDGRANFSEVDFSNVLVSDDMLLGGVGEGWMGAGRVLGVERAINKMYRAALFENEMRHLIGACRSDPQLRSLMEDAGYRQRLAACYEDIEVLRRFVRSIVQSLSRGGEIGSMGSVIKLHWSETHQRIVGLGREMLMRATRPMSDITRHAMQRFNRLYLRSRAETIQGGVSAIQLDVIADRILHLARA